jgi:predicted flap endonuclease-1-like 5' DNA nuclease
MPLAALALAGAAMPQQDFAGIPLWVWLALVLVIIVVAILWVMRRESEGQEVSGRREAEPIRPDRADQVEISPAAEAEALEEAVGREAPKAELEPEAIHGPAGLEAVEVSTQADDLVIIEGIGPVIAGVLREHGFHTFTALAAADPDRLREILQAAGLRVPTDPRSWPEQARLASIGDWATLERLQEQLKGGRQA